MNSTPPNTPPSSPFPTPRPNPFAASGSRPAPPPPPGGLFSRLGARSTLDYVAMHDMLIMFDLADAAPMLYEMLNIEPPIKDDGSTDLHDPKPLIAALDKDRTLVELLKPRLNDYWKPLHFVGAIHIYDWREEVKEAAVRRLNAIKAPPVYMRASDPLLILNVLARARSYLLIPGAALALDRPFLERVILTDDPRVLNFSTSPFTSTSLVPPPAPADDIFDDDDDNDDDK